MLCFLNTFSKTRKFWSLLVLSVIGLISINLYIQYHFFLRPCTLCIYQRCAFFGIIIAGLIVLINPNTLLRFFGILIWIFSSFKGFCLSKQHIVTIFHSTPFFVCELSIEFPNWIPLHKLWPSMFNVDTGNCLNDTWYFLSLEISQWTLLIFSNHLILSIYTMIAQFIYSKNSYNSKNMIE